MWIFKQFDHKQSAENLKSTFGYKAQTNKMLVTSKKAKILKPFNEEM